MTVTFDPYPLQLTDSASVFVAVRFWREGTGDDRFELLPNVKVESIHYSEGAVPPTAQFSYVLDDSDPDTPFPTTVADLWPFQAQNPYAVREDDEILVYEFRPSGERVLVFDGFVQLPQFDHAAGLASTFLAVGVAIRLWDEVIEGSDWRDGDDPEDGEIVRVTHPCWFNPHASESSGGGIWPNCTPAGHDVDEGQPEARPVFLDPSLKAKPQKQRPFNLGGFLRYLAWTHNRKETWVKNPIPPDSAGASGIDEFLKAVKPVDGQFMDLSDPSTFERSDIVVRSYDATGKPWIEAAEEQLGYHGFHLFFATYEGEDGGPVNQIIVYRKDGLDGAEAKPIDYPRAGASLEDGIPQVQEMHAARDGHKAANEIAVRTAPVEYEISVVLAPLFAIAAGDADAVETFNLSKLAGADAATKRKYRWFGVDEVGDGHWDFGAGATVNTPFDFDAVFGAPDTDEAGNAIRKWVRRYRPVRSHELFTRDEDGNPLKVELAVSWDYEGASPGLWDGRGKWLSMGSSGWKLLEDRLGIRISADNPEAWKIPRSDEDEEDNYNGGDVVRVISSLADPDDDEDTKRFYLRLTVVIRGDQAIDAVSTKRGAAPTRFTVRRSIDAADHFKKRVTHPSSMNNQTGEEVLGPGLDDTDRAKAAADAQRTAQEMPAVAGQFKIPWISHAYGVGDLLSEISGQGIDLNGAAGAPAGEGPRYPVVIGFDWMCQSPQATFLKISDRRAEPQRP